MKKKYSQKGAEKSVTGYVSNTLRVNDALKEQSRWQRKSEEGDYSLVGLKRASVLIGLYRKRPVMIVGDYDVDGKCALAILARTLKVLGFTDVQSRIPHRISEGYGINEAIIDEIESDDTLLITVDNGIAAHEAIRKAIARGLEVIITDHHLPVLDENGEPDIPEADVVIDPNAIENSADFSGYCGAGIAYKLAVYLMDHAGYEDPEFRDSLLSLAAIATVCDSVPMVEENWVFVRDGLRCLSSGKTFAGVKALLWDMYLNGHVTEEDLAYKIGPCINADNRLYDDSTLAVDLLLCDEEEKAKSLSRKLKDVNETRKELCQVAEKYADKVISAYKMEEDFPLIVNLGTKVQEGLIGILAGRLAEKYNVPAIVFCETEGDILKGSARTAGGIDLHKVISSSAAPLLSTFGGHAAACGLSVKKENYRQMRENIKTFCEQNEERPEDGSDAQYDLSITEEEVPETLKELRKYAPYGEQFPEPVFRIANFKVIPKDGGYFKTMAKEGVKFSGASATAVGFGFSELLGTEKPKTVDFYGKLSENYFKGQVTPQIVFDDLDITSRYVFRS